MAFKVNLALGFLIHHSPPQGSESMCIQSHLHCHPKPAVPMLLIASTGSRMPFLLLPSASPFHFFISDHITSIILLLIYQLIIFFSYSKNSHLLPAHALHDLATIALCPKRQQPCFFLGDCWIIITCPTHGAVAVFLMRSNAIDTV